MKLLRALAGSSPDILLDCGGAYSAGLSVVYLLLRSAPNLKIEHKGFSWIRSGSRPNRVTVGFQSAWLLIKLNVSALNVLDMTFTTWKPQKALFTRIPTVILAVR